MLTFKTYVGAADGIESLLSFMRSVGGNPREWTVGISHDAAERLKTHGQASNPYAKSLSTGSEEIARRIEKWFKTNWPQMKGDTGGGKPGRPPTEVYIFREPRFPNWRETLAKAKGG